MYIREMMLGATRLYTRGAEFLGGYIEECRFIAAGCVGYVGGIFWMCCALARVLLCLDTNQGL